MALNTFIRKDKRSKINNLIFHLRKLEKEKQIKFKIRRKEVKIRAEIKEIKNKKSIEKINEMKICFFEMTNKIGKPLARLTKKKVRRHTLLISEMKEGTSPQNSWTLKG